MSNDAIFKGDNTAAFGNDFIKISIDNPAGYIISKAIFVCGCLKKTFDNPQFPIYINLTSEETSMLRGANVCYLVVYDGLGRQKTCNGTLTFNAKNGVICNDRGTCC